MDGQVNGFLKPVMCVPQPNQGAMLNCWIIIPLKCNDFNILAKRQTCPELASSGEFHRHL